MGIGVGVLGDLLYLHYEARGTTGSMSLVLLRDDGSEMRRRYQFGYHQKKDFLHYTCVQGFTLKGVQPGLEPGTTCNFHWEMTQSKYATTTPQNR